MRRGSAGRYECDCDITDHPEKREREGRDHEEKGSKKRKQRGREGEREKRENSKIYNYTTIITNLWQP